MGEPRRDLDAAAWSAFLAASSRTAVYPTGGFLFLEGDPSGPAFGIVRGRVKIVAHAERGRDLVLDIRGHAQLVGEVAPIDESPRSASAVAVEETEVAIVDGEDFRTLVSSEGPLAAALLPILARRLRDTTRLHVDQRGADVIRRLARRLCDVANISTSPTGSHGAPSVALRQDELGELIGANRETASRGLSRLRDLGLVATGRGRITILDPVGLLLLAESSSD